MFFTVETRSSRRWRLLVAAALASAGMAASSVSTRAQAVWQMATEYPETAISGVGLVTFATLVAAETGGAVTVINTFDNKMKITSGVMVQGVEAGKITGGDAFAGPLEPADPIFGLPSLPFVVQSTAAAKTINDKARPLYVAALKAHHLKLLYITVWPSTGLWSDHPVATADDLKTLIVRTYDPQSAAVMTAAGATAEFLPFNEAIARVKDHRLNAILSSGDGGAGRKLWDDLRYFTPINYAIPISVAFMRDDVFGALPKSVQAQVEKAAAETERRQFESLSNRMAENEKRMRQNGVTISEAAPPGVMARLKAAAQGPIAAWKAKVGADARGILDHAE